MSFTTATIPLTDGDFMKNTVQDMKKDGIFSRMAAKMKELFSKMKKKLN